MMQSPSDIGDIHEFLKQHETKELVRIFTCGSVDDGKSTLIGRLLYDTNMIEKDTLESLEKESKSQGTQGGALDPALLLDGLKAEREQGITIDVAYRSFITKKRKFIIADTPGHEQYTRNMATGASTADLAIILVDARKGVIEQTRRHSFIASLLGIKHVLVAVNKMDLTEYSEAIFNEIQNTFADFATRLEIDDLHFIPLSALHGDNVVEPSANMPWYRGSTLLHMLETIHIASDRNFIDFRFPVQFVNRPSADYRGYSGTIASGSVSPGQEVVVYPSKKKSRIQSIDTPTGPAETAFVPMSVTLTLEDEIDISRGDMLMPVNNVADLNDSLEAFVVWMDDDDMKVGKDYLFKQSTKEVSGSIAQLRYEIDVNTLHRTEVNALKMNSIGRCSIELTQPLAFDSYQRNKATGSFIIIDKLTNRTVGAGMILDRKSQTEESHWNDEPKAKKVLKPHHSQVTEEERSTQLAQKPVTILLSGQTGCGKTVIAYALERALFEQGLKSTVLDGEDMRLSINRDLGFDTDGRSENLRRIAEVAKLMNDAGLICILALQAPQESVRQKAKELIGSDRFLTIHLTAPDAVLRERDSKGLYEGADKGEIANFPGVSAEYEEPENPDLVLNTDEQNIEECTQKIVEMLQQRNLTN